MISGGSVPPGREPWDVMAVAAQSRHGRWSYSMRRPGMPAPRYNLSVTTSFFDLYKIGVGPSSSHTMGPMRAAFQFARGLEDQHVLDRVHRVRAELYGSLALTGIGHAPARAVLLGLAGHEAATIDPASIESSV